MTSLPTAVLFAFDGTLADVSALAHLVGGRRLAFTSPAADAYYARTLAAPAHGQVAQLARLEKQIGRSLIVVCGRPEKYRAVTEAWLLFNNIPFDALLMRTDGDWRPEVAVKEELVTPLLDRFEIVHAYDSRADAAVLYGSMGIPATLLPAETRAEARSRTGSLAAS
jgi:hypothetical protein